MRLIILFVSCAWLALSGCGTHEPPDSASIEDGDEPSGSDTTGDRGRRGGILLLPGSDDGAENDSEMHPSGSDTESDTADTSTARDSDFQTDTSTARDSDFQTDTSTARDSDFQTDTSDVETDTRDASTDTDAGSESDGTDTGTVPPHVEVILNPYTRPQLVAVIKMSHVDLVPEAVDRIEVTVKGQNDSEDLTAELLPQSEAFKTNFDMSDLLDDKEVGIPVLGLFPGVENRVLFTVSDGVRSVSGEVDVETGPLDWVETERAIVRTADTTRMEPGWTWFNGRVYDHQGNLRWYSVPAYEHLENGNILTGVDEKNWLGRKVHDRTLPGYLSFHHDAVSIPNGNVLACVSNMQTSVVTTEGTTVESVEDYIVELDHDTGEIVNAWDLRDYLDVDRGTWCDGGDDWFHLNTLAYDAQDDAIIVSGRHQGLVKLTRGGLQGEEANLGKSLVWILAPHLDWEASGDDGQGALDPGDYLLTAVDSDGVPYPQDVQDNLQASRPELDAFFWPLGQHGISITSRAPGKLSMLVFNNQASFLLNGPGTIDNGVCPARFVGTANDRSDAPYSQIIEYEIDEEAMTVRRLWSFGEGDPELYGSRNSGVTLLKNTGNRLIITAGLDEKNLDDNPLNPHIVEVTESGEVVFHLEIQNTGLSAYQGGRVDLYHPER